ncbi:MAG: substrate-binding domain-containing protein [Rhizobiaceae bacterium]
MNTAAIAIALAAVVTTGNPARAETVYLHAAGSLRNALTDVAKAFEAASGNTVTAKSGPSGLLRKEIADRAKAEVFASANMTHPKALSDAGRDAGIEGRPNRVPAGVKFPCGPYRLAP